jgi:hypothetical protein
MRKLLLALLLAALPVAVGAQIKISGLPAGTTLAGTEPIAAVQSTVTVKTTPAAISTYTKSTINSAFVYGLWSGTCNSTTFLRGDGACAAPVSAVLTATSTSIGGGALAAGACASTTVATTGATTAMVAEASPVTDPGTGNLWQAFVSAADTVTVRVCAVAAGTPTASVYNIRVIK